MEKVLPGVENEDGASKLDARNEDMVDKFGRRKFPSGKGWRLGIRSVVTAGQRTGKKRVGWSHVLGNRGGVDAHDAQQGGQGALHQADARGPDGNVVVGTAGHLGRVKKLEHSAGRDLDDLLNEDIAGDLVSRCVVALEDLLGRVEAILRKEVEDVD